MVTPEDIMKEVEGYPAEERAAAIAHYVYQMTAERVGWGSRVPPTWTDLPEEARHFNVAAIESWARNAVLFDAWCQAVRQLGAS
jgi:hypothetical protein